MRTNIFPMFLMLATLTLGGCGSDDDDTGSTDADNDGYAADVDCDDDNSSIYPGATEACDGVDNNCDGSIDEGFTTTSYYQDQDGDGYGSDDTVVSSCTSMSGYVTQGGDCDENDTSVNPGMTEVACNGFDENCTGSDDDHPDSDNDGYDACDVGVPEADANAADCNDSASTQNPGAVETCNGADDNCDGEADEGLNQTTYYLDSDGDGFGSPDGTTTACSLPYGYALEAGDCDDTNAQVYPDAIETPSDGIDSDCDGLVDTIFTVSGGDEAGNSGDDGPAEEALLNGPTGMAKDVDGVIYFADTDNHKVRKIGLDGTITTVAGTGEAGYDDTEYVATQTPLNTPRAVSVGVSGDIFIADTYNHMIRKVSSDGFITIVAGTGEPGSSGDGQDAQSALLNSPSGVNSDAFGNIFISDTGNNRVRKINAGSVVIGNYAGNGEAAYYGDTSAAANAALNAPQGVTTDANGTLYIADTGNHCVRKVTTISSIITTVAGRGESPGFYGDGGAATSAKLDTPTAVYAGPNRLYIADSNNNRIRFVYQEGKNSIIRTIAGTGDPEGDLGDGDEAQGASLDLPSGLVMDANNNLLISDFGHNRIRSIDW